MEMEIEIEIEIKIEIEIEIETLSLRLCLLLSVFFSLSSSLCLLSLPALSAFSLSLSSLPRRISQDVHTVAAFSQHCHQVHPRIFRALAVPEITAHLFDRTTCLADQTVDPLTERMSLLRLLIRLHELL